MKLFEMWFSQRPMQFWVAGMRPTIYGTSHEQLHFLLHLEFEFLRIELTEPSAKANVSGCRYLERSWQIPNSYYLTNPQLVWISVAGKMLDVEVDLPLENN